NRVDFNPRRAFWAFREVRARRPAEGGWRPGKYRVSAPDHFLRRAKAETYWPLLQKIAKINEKMVGEIFAEKRRRTAAARELREMQRKARKG
ncbi:MAG: hypothetical protein IJO40_12535, partial [Thermoguttaceae bacterium]|nr:hypothetical protein [Thermoguttaceae bacterium]